MEGGKFFLAFLSNNFQTGVLSFRVAGPCHRDFPNESAHPRIMEDATQIRWFLKGKKATFGNKSFL
jgi:hypothetical protein